MIFSNPALT